MLLIRRHRVVLKEWKPETGLNLRLSCYCQSFERRNLSCWSVLFHATRRGGRGGGISLTITPTVLSTVWKCLYMKLQCLSSRLLATHREYKRSTSPRRCVMSYMISLMCETLKTSYLLPHSNCLNFCDHEDVFKTIRQSQNMHLVLEKRHDEIPNLQLTRSIQPTMALFRLPNVNISGFVTHDSVSKE
jgi:hypothetical protein